MTVWCALGEEERRIEIGGGWAQITSVSGQIPGAGGSSQDVTRAAGFVRLVAGSLTENLSEK